MRAERLIRLILQLRRTADGLTVAALANGLGVSARTVHRDLDALSVLGIPVYCERGRAGGVRLAGDASQLAGLAALSSDEASALALVASPAAVDGALGAPASALAKLLDQVPAVQQMAADFARHRLLFDTTPWFRNADLPAAFPLLKQAVWESRVVHFTYRRLDHTTQRYRAEPLALAAKVDEWYCIADTERGRRVFRQDRMSDLSISDRRFERDALDLHDFWDRWVARFQSNVPNTLWLDLDLTPTGHRRLLAQYGEWAGRHLGRAVGSRRTRRRMNFETQQRALSALLPLGRHVTVMAPLTFARKLARLGAEIAVAHRANDA